MHSLYKEKCEADGVEKKNIVGYTKYLHHFNKMNYAIHKPKKHQCKTCVAYENKDRSAELIQAKHLEKKDAAKNLKNAMKERAKLDKTFWYSHLI